MTWFRWRKTWHLLALADEQGHWAACGHGGGNKVSTSENPPERFRCKLCIRDVKILNGGER